MSVSGKAVTDTGRQYTDLQSIYLPIAVGVFVVVALVVAFALVRYRRRGDELPNQKAKHTVAELAYVVVLACAAAFLVVVTYRTEDRVDEVHASAGLTVRVTASQWRWRFEYPGHGVTIDGAGRDATLVVPTATNVRFELTSTDVIHSFWVPQRRFKRDAFPGGTTRFDLSWPKAGVFDGECGEYCGFDHAAMTFRVRAVAPSAFAAWASRHRGRAAEPA